MSDKQPPKPPKNHPFHAPWGDPPSKRWGQTLDEVQKRRQEMLDKFRRGQ
ncbi:hypothetical protein [Synechocystis sp. LKSZ1]